jgi:hypothetical protein
MSYKMYSMAQLVELLSSKHKAMSSNPSTALKKKKRKNPCTLLYLLKYEEY